MGKLLKKEDLSRFLIKIRSKAELIAPVKKKGVILFEQIVDPTKIVLDKQPVFSPKAFFIPKKDEILRFKEDKIDYTKKIPNRIIFGIKNCDLNAITKLDKIYLHPPTDETYNERREKTLLIGYECKNPEENCFCDQFRPEKVFDLFFHDIGANYYIEVGSEKGLKLVSRLKDYDYETEKFYCTKKVKIKGLLQKYNSKEWDELSKNCTSCGRCTLLCPSCNCFVLEDKYDLKEASGKRIHKWTSCMFDEFTKKANEEAERKGVKEKFRHRVLHKFDYFFEKNNNYMCTGCGRCITNCPQKIDFTKIFSEEGEE